MKHKYLFIGDTFWGENDEVPTLVSNRLLVEHPELPLQFTLLTSPRYTPQYLLEAAPREILGRQAGNIILGLGWADLIAGMKGELLADHCLRLLHEIHNNSHARVWVILPPAESHPEGSLRRQATLVCQQVLARENIPDRTQILIFDAVLDHYNQLQAPRGEGARRLISESSGLTGLGQVLLSSVLVDSLRPAEPAALSGGPSTWLRGVAKGHR